LRAFYPLHTCIVEAGGILGAGRFSDWKLGPGRRYDGGLREVLRRRSGRPLGGTGKKKEPDHL